MARTIQSPGVEIREVDLTLRPASVNGTYVFVPGFADQGPIDEVLEPATLAEFELIYGKPTNPAEQYFYQTAKAVYNSTGKVVATRLPYGEDKGEGFDNWRYSALVYPVRAISTDFTAETSSNVTSTSGLSGANTYLFGKPTHIELDSEQYSDLINGNVNWTNNPTVTSKNTSFDFSKLGSAGLIVLNKSQTTINDSFEGYYVGAIDNNNFNPATPYNGITSVESLQTSLSYTNSYTTIPTSRLNFPLSANQFGAGMSVSEVMENMGSFDLGNNNFDDTIAFGLFKLRKSVYGNDTVALDYVLSESYVGSFDYNREIGDQNGGPAKTFSIESIANNSNNVHVLVNPFISNKYDTSWVDNEGNPTKKVRFLSTQLKTPLNGGGFTDTSSTYLTRVGALSSVVETAFNELGSTDSIFALGVYNSITNKCKDIGHLPNKLERAFELIENVELYQVNLAVEGGLGTIYVNALEDSNTSGSAGPFDDTTQLNSLTGFYFTNNELTDQNALNLRSNYTSVANVFVTHAQNKRKDFMVILDPIRAIFIQSQNTKVINTKKSYSANGEHVATNFGQHIYWPLRHQFGTINTSYATTYATWAQVVDSNSNRQIWVPFSGFAAGLMANTDSNFQPWFAPAGFTRGVLTGINDIGVYPKQAHRDQLYKFGINPVNFYPSDGFVVFGQKTLLRKPSAFDRINVRRLFLNLEVAVRDTMKYFVFEPNTLFTRTRVVNTLSPIFDLAKNTEGLYDYLIVCDERNNTPEVIDNNELKVDIYIKPVRTAEFILVTFFATRTSQNFQELVGG